MIDNKLREIIAKMSLDSIFWGHLFARLKRIANEDLKYVMGITSDYEGNILLIYNPNLVNQIEDRDLFKFLEHEGLHILNKHIPRWLIQERQLTLLNESKQQKFEKQRVWNIAVDCAVNTQLINFPTSFSLNGKKCITMFPSMFNLEPKKISEYYYFELLKQEKKNQNKKGGKTNISKTGESIDRHDWFDIILEESDIDSFTRQMDQFLKSLVSSTVKSFNKNRGNIPGNIQELIDEILKPAEIPYYDIIKKLVRGSRLTKMHRAPFKINKKRAYIFVEDEEVEISPFPGRTQDRSFNISLLIDTSGSMSKEDILDALSGVKSIIEKDRHCKINIIENDTKVRKEYIVRRLSDIQFNITGRGGTILLPGLIRCEQIKSDITLVFTDGYCDNINSVSKKLIPKKIIWILSANGIAKNIDQTGIIVNIPIKKNGGHNDI